MATKYHSDSAFMTSDHSFVLLFPDFLVSVLGFVEGNHTSIESFFSYDTSKE